MRLLTRTSDDDFELVTFYDKIPPYAVLSHTWAEGEVTYEELVAGTGKHKAGYNKIRFCADRAAADNLQYLWVDTCCIDKSSSAELTEAINSMFKWYKQARVCYVQLSDLEVDNVVDDQSGALANCRWFNRGWCLQELLAPSEVRFYNRYNRYIGSKKTLRRTISRITRISEEVLDDATSLYTIPIARRMSWAAGRKTTRTEDIAYSLLGIFDVHMPMLYGEGEHAFIRLQEEIIKTSNDLSIFAWEAEGEEKPYQDMFASSPIFFRECNDMSDNGFGLRVVSRNLFAMTNRGLQCMSTNIGVSSKATWTIEEDPRYFLPLNCYINEGNFKNWRYLQLKKIGQGIFVKKRVIRHSDISFTETTRPVANIFIVPKVTRELLSTIESSRKWSFEVHANNKKHVSAYAQKVEPSEAWDDSYARFLTQGDTSFTGYLKIYPEEIFNDEREYFVLVLGFVKGHLDTPEPYGCLVHPDIWARYDAPGRSVFWVTTSAARDQRRRDKASVDNGQLDFASYTATVRLYTRDSRGVPVHTVWLDWERKQATEDEVV